MSDRANYTSYCGKGVAEPFGNDLVIQDLQQKLLASQASEARLREALVHADEFIRNGIEFGYIRMPDESLKGIDSAHDTPEIIREALSIPPNTAELESFVAKAVESEIDKRLDKYKKFHHKLSESTFLLAISIMDNLEACKSTLIVKRLRNLQDTFTEYYETLR